MNNMELVIDSIYNNYNILYDNDPSLPVDIEFETLNNSRIMIKKEVEEALKNIALTTTIDLKEIGFILYGKEYSENQVVFDKITISDAKLKSTTTEFGPLITEELNHELINNLDDRTVICYGHTHPNISNEYNFFSLSDLTSLVELTTNNKEFELKDIQLVGCLLTNEIKFIYYDPYDNNFYKISNIEYEQL